MKSQPSKDILRLIPAVDRVLASPQLAERRARHPRFPWTAVIRDVIDALRSGDLKAPGQTRDRIESAIVHEAIRRVDELRLGGMRRVINATGVILHTNLGRSILSETARAAAVEAMGRYVNLEVDLESGNRNHRGETLNALVRLASGSEAAMVVNNNAAAVYLVVSSYSPPGRVLISRGELVEIGGSFRLPDILQRAASTMVEVGTTNRTYIDDYAREARPGDILMRAHRSNYDIQGFTHDTTVAELVALARERDCHVVYDLGSGSLFDFDRIGIVGEERVRDVVATGVDCITMSGDKLLGGTQAGIIVGRKKFLDRFDQNPLRRALRVDKIVIGAMQALMRTYLFSEDPVMEVPTLQLASQSVKILNRRAEAVVAGLSALVRERHGVEVVADDAAIGGGSFAVQPVASVAIVLRCGDDEGALAMARRMRRQAVPLLGRIKGSEIKLNMRSVLPDEDADLRAAIENALADATRDRSDRAAGA